MKPEKKAPPHIKADPEVIGKLWGMEIYAQRKQRLEQLQAIRAVLARDDFPPKVKGKGYERAAVAQYGMAHIKLDAKGRRVMWVDKVDAAKVQSPKSKVGETGKLLDAGQETSDIPDGELFASDASGWEKTLDLWEDKLKNPEKWLMAPIQSWQVKHLQTHRPQLFAKTETALEQTISENIEGGYRGVAQWIRNNYSGRLSRVPSHTDIVNWNKGEYLPAGCRENFPSSDANNSRYKTALVTAWVEKYLLKTQAGQDLPMAVMDDRQRQEKADADLAEMKVREMERATGDKWILRADAEVTVTGALKLHHVFVKKHFEKGFGVAVVERLRPLNLAHEQLVAIAAAVGECGRAVISAVEDDCQKKADATA